MDVGFGDGCVVGAEVVGLGDKYGAGQRGEDGNGVVGAGEDDGSGLSVGAQEYSSEIVSQQGVPMEFSLM